MNKLMQNKAFLVGASLIMLVGIFLMASHLLRKADKEKLSFLAQEKAELFVRPHSPVKGEADAPIYITEFLDPECESCRAASTYVNQLMDEYKGKIKLAVRYAAFHQNSVFAIKILEAARLQGKYWETLDVLFQHQPEWGDHHHPRPELIWNYLPQAGVDVEKIKADMESPKTLEIIRIDREDAQALQVRGTPTFFVNGEPLEGHGPDYLKQAIEKHVGAL